MVSLSGLRMLEKAPRRGSGGSSRAEGVERERGEKEALRILREGSGLLGLPLSKADLEALKKATPARSNSPSCCGHTPR